MTTGVCFGLSSQIQEWLKTKQGQVSVTDEMKKAKAIKRFRIGLIDMRIAELEVIAIRPVGEVSASFKGVLGHIFQKRGETNNLENPCRCSVASTV